MSPTQSLSFRSYGADGAVHRHDHVQLVLPVLGELEIEVEGRGGRLDIAQAAFVAPGADHVQSGGGANSFLIVDCDIAEVGEAAAERLARQVFVEIPPAARRLMEFVDLSRGGGAVSAAVVRHCTPLLLGALIDAPARPSRMAGLVARMQAEPGRAWSVAEMARLAGMSPSRLHAAFKAEYGETPQQFLSQIRLRAVQEALASGDEAIAELAYRTGYSDQSALTRAMRRATGVTPAAYRRRHRR